MFIFTRVGTEVEVRRHRNSLENRFVCLSNAFAFRSEIDTLVNYRASLLSLFKMEFYEFYFRIAFYFSIRFLADRRCPVWAAMSQSVIVRRSQNLPTEVFFLFHSFVGDKYRPLYFLSRGHIDDVRFWPSEDERNLQTTLLPSKPPDIHQDSLLFSCSVFASSFLTHLHRQSSWIVAFYEIVGDKMKIIALFSLARAHVVCFWSLSSCHFGQSKLWERISSPKNKKRNETKNEIYRNQNGQSRWTCKALKKFQFLFFGRNCSFARFFSFTKSTWNIDDKITSNRCPKCSQNYVEIEKINFDFCIQLKWICTAKGATIAGFNRRINWRRKWPRRQFPKQKMIFVFSFASSCSSLRVCEF